MRVRAVSRGQLIERIPHPDTGAVSAHHRIIEAGEVFECPHEQLALVSESAPGVGWMQPVDALGHAIAAIRAAQPAKAIRCADGLWPVGHHASYDMSRRIPVSNDPTDVPPRAA